MWPVPVNLNFETGWFPFFVFVRYVTVVEAVVTVNRTFFPIQRAVEISKRKSPKASFVDFHSSGSFHSRFRVCRFVQVGLVAKSRLIVGADFYPCRYYRTPNT
jgi:hypothetical protein